MSVRITLNIDYNPETRKGSFYNMDVDEETYKWLHTLPRQEYEKLIKQHADIIVF